MNDDLFLLKEFMSENGIDDDMVFKKKHILKSSVVNYIMYLNIPFCKYKAIKAKWLIFLYINKKDIIKTFEYKIEIKRISDFTNYINKHDIEFLNNIYDEIFFNSNVAKKQLGLKKDLAENTVVVYKVSVLDEEWKLGFYHKYGRVKQKKDNSLFSIKEAKIIVPLDHFDINNFTYNKKYNYGA